MKTSRLLLLTASYSLLATHYPLLAATPVAATSSISAVTVYADRAVVTRTARVELPAGVSEVVFETLPDTIVDASLQVSAGVRPRAGGSAPIVPGPVAAAATATILDVSARVTYTEASPDPREKALEDDLLALRKADRVLADDGRVLARRRELLGQIEGVALAPESAAAPAAPRLAFADWEKLLAFSDKAATDVETRQRELDQKITESAAKIAAAEARLRDLRGSRPSRKSHKTVTVRLSAPAAGALDLALTCAVPNASWSPVYDARLRTEPRVVELGYFGLVRNATGEDWNNVALVLSTARPSLGGGSAEPSAWILDVARPVPVAQGQRGGAGGQLVQQQALSNTRALASNNLAVGNGAALVNNDFADFNTTAGAVRIDRSNLAWSTATVDAGATSATFSIKDYVTLPGDNTPRRVAITAASLPAQLQYQSVPRTAETAFLSAYINNTTDAPLLPGELNVFLDDNFVAAGRHAAATMPGERFQLALGADEGIAIKRRLVNRLSETVGLSGTTTRVTYEYQFTVTNNKKSAQRVMFKDVLPVSRDEKFVVKLIEPTEREIVKAEDITVPGSLPKPGITREEDGRIVFRADVAPGKAGERKFTLKFTVEFPTDTPVAGLQ
jgi:uncharacterized protein (TIGR02231 family)